MIGHIIRPVMRPLVQELTSPPSGSAPAAYSPADLFAASEAGVWYDPSDFSTLFQDSAETTAVTAASDPIGAAVDKSGNGNDIKQSTAGSRLLLAQDGNGFWYFDGDGVDDFLVTPSNVATGPSKKATIFIAFMPDITTLRTMNDFADGITPGGFLLSTAASTFQVTAVGDINAPTGTYSGFPTAAVYIATVQIDLTTGTVWADTVTVRKNGVVVAVDSTPGAVPGTADFLAQPLNLFGVRFNGRIYGYICRFAESTAQEIEDTEAWLNERCGAF